MHEMAMAQSLVDAISEEARKHGRPIRAKMSCGVLNTVNDDVLSFAFETLAQGTPCEGMQLQIEHKLLQATCKACGCVFAVDWSGVRCPDCGADDFELLPDAPLLLEQIEFEGVDDGEGEHRQEDPGRQ
jgi:hydrogenase nickel incorporation protein HypA/HybF